jgi:hypothetical protein
VGALRRCRRNLSIERALECHAPDLPLLAATALAALSPTAATAAAPRLGTPAPIPIRLPASSSIQLAVSAAGHGPAIVTEGQEGKDNIVLHRDHGTWRKFAVPGRPQAVRLALLEDGGGLAAWDEGDAVYVRRWTARGAVKAPQIVLSSVQTAWVGDFGAAEWQLSAARDGTVAIASMSLDGAITATIRDPGGTFGP